MIDIPTNNSYDLEGLKNELAEKIVNKLRKPESYEYYGTFKRFGGEYDAEVIYPILRMFSGKGYYCYIKVNGIGHDWNYYVRKKPMCCGMLTREV